VLNGIAGGARAELPPGWSVQVFSGRVLDIAPAGGVLACATDGGLLFYEPASGRFQQIADAGCTDDDCLRSNRLSAVTRDAAGQYWVGMQTAGVAGLRSARGVWEYNHFFAANLKPGGGLLSDSVTAIAAWKSDAVYVGTTAGVAQIDLAGAVGEYNEEASRRRGVDNFPDARVNDVAVDSTFVWVATETGMARYSRLPPNDVEIVADSLEGTRALCVALLGGRVFAGTNLGVHLWDEPAHRWRRVRNAAGTPQPTPSFAAYTIALLPNPQDPQILRLYVGSDLDMFAYNGFAWGRCSSPGVALIESRAFRTVVATGDTLWTSQGNANGEGAYLETLLPGQGCNWQRHQPGDPVPADDDALGIVPSAVAWVNVGPDGETLWIGTQLGGVARRSPAGSWCAYNGNDPNVAAHMSDPSGHVSALLADRGGSVWFGTLPIDARATVDVLTPDTGCVHTADRWNHIAPDERGFGGRYWRIAEDGRGYRFFLSDGDPAGPGGLDVLSADTLGVGNLRADVLGGSGVGGIAFNRASGPWSEAYVGVNHLGGAGLRRWRYSTDDDIFNPSPLANLLPLPLDTLDVAEYHDIEYQAETGRLGDLWVGTDTGIFRYDLDTRSVTLQLGRKENARPGLLAPQVRDLLLDDRGNLWIATAAGLNRIHVRDSLLTVDAFSTRETIEALNASAGAEVGILYLLDQTLAPLPSSDVRSLAYQPSVHTLHIGTAAGLASVDVERLDALTQVPIEKAHVYPNPVRALTAEDEKVFVANVSFPAHVTIYNLEGEIVSEKLLTAAGEEAWDLKVFIQQGGAQGAFLEAASGVYLVRVDTDTGTKVTPLVVIR
jgi:ligand-binding sensor domain-containing protein